MAIRVETKSGGERNPALVSAKVGGEIANVQDCYLPVVSIVVDRGATNKADQTGGAFFATKV
jgi:hypothetical protein